MTYIPRYNPSPQDQGLIAWTCDPAATNTTQIIPGVGQLMTAKLVLPVLSTVTNIIMSIATQGSGLTSGQNFAGLYNPSGALLSGTADQTTNWGSAGLKTIVLSSQQTNLPPGIYTVAFYSNGTTLPTLRVGTAGSSWPNAGLATANSRFGIANTGLTTALPGTVGAITANEFAWWIALS
jgi:hypothetical protein